LVLNYNQLQQQHSPSILTHSIMYGMLRSGISPASRNLSTQLRSSNLSTQLPVSTPILYWYGFDWFT